jgi:hypothetical protein
MDDSDGTDPAIGELVEELHHHLTATQELPVETTASRWIGEAEAVVGDVVGGAPEPAIEKRVGQASHLLENVEDTGDPTADDHVAQAKTLVDRIERRLAG